MADFAVGQLLRIFVGERDLWKGRPLHEAIVEVLRGEGVSGASVFRGIEGFGSHQEIHLAKAFRFGDDLPILIEVVDAEETIARLIPQIDEMIGEGTMTLERVEYRRFRKSKE
jgi:PII-like signaling protein